MKEKKRIILMAGGLVILMALLYIETLRTQAGKVMSSTDLFIMNTVQRAETDSLTQAVLAVTSAGSVYALGLTAVLGALFLGWRKRWRMALFYPAAVGAGGLINWLLKGIFQRERPDLNPLLEEPGFSFPSGHSMGSMMTFGLLAYFIIRLSDRSPVRIATASAAAVIIFSIGLSRIYLGVHYPTDVVAGFLAGGIWIFISVLVWKRWFETKPGNRKS
ncbi:phosphatase PAP2 family protein [Alteribacter lacisalsi]|uniref:phosphatase PAP2 family protein n=1 Tax=Alteribacter lacisalsi TaxID=2045244 RepID=UPI0013750AEF|nr:phosphatase PAP2 family protein [Alteribacter lacisalsi]